MWEGVNILSKLTSEGKRMKTFILGIIIASVVWISLFQIYEYDYVYFPITISTVNTTALIESGFLEPSDNFTLETDHYEFYSDGYFRGIYF